MKYSIRLENWPIQERPHHHDADRPRIALSGTIAENHGTARIVIYGKVHMPGGARIVGNVLSLLLAVAAAAVAVVVVLWVGGRVSVVVGSVSVMVTKVVTMVSFMVAPW